MLVSSKKFLLKFSLFAFILLGAFFVRPLVTQADALNAISGTFTDRAGNPLANAQFKVTSTTGNTATFSTDSSGHYSVNVIPDRYAIQFNAAYTYNTHRIFLFNSTKFIDATLGSVIQNLKLDDIKLNVTFVDQNSNPIPNAQVTLRSSSGETTLAVGRPDVGFLTGSNLSTAGTTGANGVKQAVALRGIKYDVCALNPATGVNTCTSFTPTDDISAVTVTAPLTYNISGNLTNRAGNPLANASFKLDAASKNEAVIDMASFTTNSSGHYSVNVAPDKYALRFESYTYNNLKMFLFSNTQISDSAYFIDATNSNVAQDFKLDDIKLNVTFVDENNNPIPNAQVTLRSFSGATTLAVGRPDILFYPDSSLSTMGVTASNGVKEAIALRGIKYEICARDPATSINTCALFTPLDDISAFTLAVPSAKPAAPTGLNAPSPTDQSPALTWNAVSGVDHYDIYRDGNKVGTTTSRTYTDTGATEGSRSYYVTAVSSSNLSSDPSNTITVVYDITAPTITYVVSPAADSSGWNNSNVTVTFTCNDSLSGIQGCPSPVTVSTEGASQAISGTATDNAGNSSSATTHISLDKTAPTIMADVDRQPDTNGWYNNDVTIAYTCNDDLSGVQNCPAPVTVSVEGTSQAIVGTVTDNAGNSADVTTTLSIDKAKPTIMTSTDRQPNVDGWYNSDVTVSYTCSDNLSDIQSCPPPTTVTTEGANQTVSGTATDNAGNTAPVSTSLNIDKTAPVLIAPPSWTSNPLQQGQSTTLSIAATDSLSGVKSLQYVIDGGTPQAMTYDSTSNSWKATFGASMTASTYTVTISATDYAGNVSQPITDILAIYSLSNGYVTGHAKTLPTANDTLPIARDTSNNPTKLVAGFTNVTAPTSGSFDISYVIKNNKDAFSLSSTDITWVVLQDNMHASILGHADMTVYVNSTQTVTQNVSVRFDIVLGTNGAPDHITIKIYNPGIDPSTGTPTYVISDDVIANGSNLMIHP